MIDIKDIQGNIKLSLKLDKGCKRKYTLQKEDYILLKFSLLTPIQFKLGDYVNDGLFELIDTYKPKRNTSTGGYDYELQLDAYYRKWKNKIFKYTQVGQEASWNLTATLDTHLGVFLKNLQALGYKYRGLDFVFSIDDSVENKSQLVSYDNTNMLDALSLMAETWNCEWWVTENIIHFGKCEFGTAVEFEEGVNVEEMSVENNSSTYGTRIIAFGSTRNIPANYRPVDESVVVNGVVQRRLMLPSGTPYIDAYPNMSQEEAVENIVIFDDIYPRRTGTMSDITTKEYTDTVENEDGTETKTKWNAYRFKDNGITFSKDYVLTGNELKIKFESGKLNGLEFAVTFNPDGKPEKIDGSWNPEAQLWEIVRNDDYGRNLPDTILKPEAGDKYVLSGFDTKFVSDAYIPLAEQELFEKATEYAEKIKIDSKNYPCKMMYDEESDFYDVGQKVKLISSAYFEGGSRQSRIIGFEYPLDKPYDHPVYTVGESISYSRLGNIENKLDTLTFQGQTYQGVGGSGVYLIRQNDSTPASDSNVFSALRALKEFLLAKKDSTAEGVITFLKGLLVGDGTKGIDKNGNANLLSLILGKFGITEQGVANLLSVISNKFESLNFVTGILGSGFTLKIDENGDSYIEIDRALFRKSATFVEIIIQSLKHVGGQIILTPASMHCIKVESYSTYYRCYFRDSDGDRTIFNEFVVGDMARSQTFNIKAGVSHNVSNGYYWRKVIGVGDDYIDLSKTDCDAGSTVPQPFDDIVQLGNESDVTRQAALVLSAFGNDAPYLKFYKGINSYSMTGKEIVNISRSEVSIIADKFKFSTGESVKDYIDGIDNDITTTVSILEGMFKSEVSSIRTESNQNNNILYNSSFAENTYGWSVANGTSLFQVSKEFLWFNKAFYANKTNVAEVSTYDSRWVLRIKSSSISQLNSSYYLHPTFVKSEDKDGNILSAYSPKKFYLSFWGKVTSGGTLAVNFANTTGGDTFTSFDRMSINETLSVDSEYRLYEYSGLWDGKGDITISFSGDMLLFNLSFSEDKYDSISTKFDTKIIQTDRKIQSLVTQVETNANGIESNASSITQTAKAIRSEVSSSVSTLDGKISANTSSITQTNNSITALTKKISFDSSGKITNISTSGLVTTSTFAGLFSQNVDSNGLVKSAQISAFITADEAGNLISKAAIRADQINLTGAVTFAMFNSALQSTINSKANSSDLTADKISGLGTLAKLNSVGMGNLATVIQNNINSISGKATAADISTAISNLGLGNISKLNEIGYSNLATALKNSIDAIGGKIDSSYLSNNGYINNLVSALTNQVAIAGGFIKASMIDVDSLYVKHLSGADGDFTGKVTATSGKIGNMGIDSNGAMSGAGQTFTDIPTYTSFVSSSDESSFKYRIANKIIWNFMKTEVIVLCPDFVGINPSASFYVVNLPTATTVINAGKAYCGFPLKIIAHRNKKYNSNGEVVCLNNVCYRITSNSRVKETSSFPGFEANTSYSVPNGELCNNDGDYVSYIDMTDGDILELYYINGVYHITNRRS